MLKFLRYFTSVACLLAALFALGGPRTFNRGQEFPNLFLDPEYWGRSPNSIPVDAVSHSESEVNDAIFSMLSRMDTFIVPAGSQKPQLVPIMDYLQKTAGSGVSIRPLARSVLGTLYSKLYQIYLRSPSDYHPDQALREITQESTRYQISDLWGVGSDFDVLIDNGGKNEKDLADRLKTTLDSVRTRYGVQFSRTGENRALYLLGDVKPYRAQVERSVAQGGSTLDFVAFDMKTHRLIDPPGLPGTVPDLIRGYRHYIDPVVPNGAIDVTVVRGMRPATEIPYLELDPESQARILRDMDTASRIRSDKAQEQMLKLERNSRFSGANNVFLRAPDGTPEKKYYQIAQASQKPFPEFLETFPITGEGRSTGDLPRSVLIPMDKFRQIAPSFTLYHGTPEIENSLAILRNNFKISSTTQGMAAYGRGTYSAIERSFASGYSGNGGVVIPLKIKSGVPINIVDRDLLVKTPFYQKKLKELGSTDAVFQDLAANYGVDLIYNKNPSIVLLENADAVERPSVATLIQASVDAMKASMSKSAPILDQLKALQVSENLLHYARDIGMPDLPDIDSTRDSLIAKARQVIALSLKQRNSGNETEAKRIAHFILNNPNIPVDDKLAQQIFQLSGNGLDVHLATDVVKRSPATFIPIFRASTDYNKQFIQWRLLELFGKADGNIPLEFEPDILAMLDREKRSGSLTTVAEALGGFPPHENQGAEEILLSWLERVRPGERSRDVDKVVNAFRSIQFSSYRNMQRFLALIPKLMILQAEKALENQTISASDYPDFERKVLKLAKDGYLRDYVGKLLAKGNWSKVAEKTIVSMVTEEQEGPVNQSRAWALRQIADAGCESQACFSAVESAAIEHDNAAAIETLNKLASSQEAWSASMKRILTAKDGDLYGLSRAALDVASRARALSEKDSGAIDAALAILKKYKKTGWHQDGIDDALRALKTVSNGFVSTCVDRQLAGLLRGAN